MQTQLSQLQKELLTIRESAIVKQQEESNVTADIVYLKEFIIKELKKAATDTSNNFFVNLYYCFDNVTQRDSLVAWLKNMGFECQEKYGTLEVSLDFLPTIDQLTKARWPSKLECKSNTIISKKSCDSPFLSSSGHHYGNPWA